MLERILNKKVRVGVAFEGTMISYPGATQYYEGVIVAYDENFVVFNDDSMINIKYIQSIKVL